MALHLLESSRHMRFLPTVVTYGAAISACEKGGEWELACSIFHSSLSDACTPNTITMDSCISAGEKAGQWQLALQVLGSMCSFQVEKVDVSCNAAISACEKAARWQLTGVILGHTAANNCVSLSLSLSLCCATSTFLGKATCSKLVLEGISSALTRRSVRVRRGNNGARRSNSLKTWGMSLSNASPRGSITRFSRSAACMGKLALVMRVVTRLTDHRK